MMQALLPMAVLFGILLFPAGILVFLLGCVLSIGMWGVSKFTEWNKP